ncbi:winged helix-turn-helix transcriptional regulator [Variovorax sp. Root434]|uniref:winged helix-turn-helix transcriptional regulator n=2 Tax=unclassified Variovorax TaxID=663243 RepID=UPI00070061BA|nr:transcriptional regulator [Variovorax sp. Root434]
MSTKENAAVSQLLALLEARYALRVLWALRDGHAQTFRLLQDSVGGITPNTLNTRIKELREAGIVGHGSDGYSLTLSGQDLLKRLSDLQAFAGKWQLGQLKKAAAPAPAAAAVSPAAAPAPAPVAAPAPTPAPPSDDTSQT